MSLFACSQCGVQKEKTSLIRVGGGVRVCVGCAKSCKICSRSFAPKELNEEKTCRICFFKGKNKERTDVFTEDREAKEDCIQCGDSGLVRAGNSYYTCRACRKR